MRDEIVLNTIKKAGKAGVTAYDFPKGLHFKDAVFRLRARGHKITMQMILDTKGIKRNIGLYRWAGKQDKPYIVNADYQQETLGRLPKCKEFSNYKKLLKNTHCNKGVLDFINREITNYNLKGK